MDPTTTKQWEWRSGPRENRELTARILWTLHEAGPFEDSGGAALGKLDEAMRERGYRGPITQLREAVKVAALRYPEVIERVTGPTQCFRLAIKPGATMPPRPETMPAVEPPPKPKRGRPAKNPEPEPETLSAADALAAISSFVESAMRMAGVVSHDITADERLAELTAENQRLQNQLLQKMRDNDLLQRALAKRNGQAVKR